MLVQVGLYLILYQADIIPGTPQLPIYWIFCFLGTGVSSSSRVRLCFSPALLVSIVTWRPPLSLSHLSNGSSGSYLFPGISESLIECARYRRGVLLTSHSSSEMVMAFSLPLPLPFNFLLSLGFLVCPPLCVSRLVLRLTQRSFE
jgi:hypothetical protein